MFAVKTEALLPTSVVCWLTLV